MIQGVMVDVDGTLVDSVDLHARAWKDAFQRFGREVGLKEGLYLHLPWAIGPPGPDAAQDNPE